MQDDNDNDMKTNKQTIPLRSFAWKNIAVANQRFFLFETIFWINEDLIFRSCWARMVEKY